MERARDLFEQCLDGCPASSAKCESYPSGMHAAGQAGITLPSFFVFSSHLSVVRQAGGAVWSRHAMSIYDRATKAVPADEQLEVSINHLSALSYFFSHINNMHVRTE